MTPRFSMDGGHKSDASECAAGSDDGVKALLQMGRRDQWTIVDLRLLRVAIGHPRRFVVNEVVCEHRKDHDLVSSPKLDIEPTKNYQK